MDNSSITYKVASSQAEVDGALALRRTVFLDELGRDRGDEPDDHDKTACHMVAVTGWGELVGTLRLYELNKGDSDVKIGRVAVRKDLRGQGIGSSMMRLAHDWAADHNYDTCYLHAEVSACDFYVRLGYTSTGPEFMESGARHVRMVRPRQSLVK